MRKIAFILIIALAAVLSVACISAGLFGDDVTVKDVTLRAFHNRTTDNYILIQMSLVSNINRDHITAVYLDNVQLKYGNDVVPVEPPRKLQYSENDANNANYKYHDSFFKDDLYIFKFFLEDTSRRPASEINHINADIYMDTTTESHILIGKLDNDITSNGAHVD